MEIPELQLAVIDVSGTLAAGCDVQRIALDDQGKVACSWSTGTGVNDEYKILKWENGQQSGSLQTLAVNEVVDSTRNLRVLNRIWGVSPDGKVFATRYGLEPNRTQDWSDWRSEHNSEYPDQVFVLDNGSLAGRQVYPDTQNLLDAVSSNAAFCISRALQDGWRWHGGAFRFFSYGRYARAINSAGFVVGSSDATGLYSSPEDQGWHPFSGYPVAVDDQNKIAGSLSQAADACIWENGVSAAPIKVADILPEAFRNQIIPKVAYLISSSGSGSAEKINVVFSGSSLEGPGKGQWVDRDFCLTKRGSNVDVRVIKIPAESSFSFNSGNGQTRLNASGILASIGKISASDSKNHGAILLPIDIAPEILKSNGNFDEGRLDPQTGYALRDCDDEDLKADRNSYHDTTIQNGKIVTKDLHKSFFGARPDTLPAGWEDGATITIEKLPEIDPDTDRPETGEVRIHAIKDLGQSGEQSWAIQLTEGTPENPTPKNLVSQLYGPNATIPKGEGINYWMEGIKPGKITLEFKYTKGSLTFTHKQKFKVVTEQNKSAWQQEARNEILLESQGQIDINGYQVAGGPLIDLLHTKYFAMNKDNILAVYKHYEKIYLVGQDNFLWAGLAKLAGAPVYAGLSDAQWGRLGGYVMPPVMAEVSGAVLKDIQTILVQANIDIYQDLAWQFAAYRASGIDALRFVDSRNQTALNFLAWQDIDDGVAEGDTIKISNGNVDLLRREQEVILATAYSNLDALGFGSVSWMFSILAENPVPGGPSFSTVVPGGNIANFADRWTWITAPSNGMWKLWTSAPENTRKGWVETLLRNCADDYNLVPLAPVW